MYSENHVINDLLGQLEQAGCVITANPAGEFLITPLDTPLNKARKELADLGFTLWFEMKAFMVSAFAFKIDREKKVRICTPNFNKDFIEFDAISQVLDVVVKTVKENEVTELAPTIMPDKKYVRTLKEIGDPIGETTIEIEE